MVQILTTSALTAVVGAFVLIVLLPRASRWLLDKVENNAAMDLDQKRKIVDILEGLAGKSSNKQVNRSTTYLSVSFLVLLGLQQYLLVVGNGTGAKIIVSGMFAMLIFHLLVSD